MEETGYLAAAGFERELATELGELSARHGRLLLAPGPARPAAWAQNVWYAPRRLEIASIADGAKALRAIQRNWALYDFRLHRRAGLIAAQLPHVSAKPIPFPSEPPKGAARLLDAPRRARHPCQRALLQPIPPRREPFHRGQVGPAQPRLSQALGSVHALGRATGAWRDVPGSWRQSGRR
jgi:hypothetical protein